MKISAALLFFCLTACNNALAHQDRILQIAQDGTLADFPSKYGPANLKVNFSGADESPPITSLVLRLGEKRIELPVCVTGLLQSGNMGEVRATGSWYHDEALHPYYLNLTFFDSGYSIKKWANSGFKLLFNLRTGKVIKMEAQIVRDGGRTIEYLPVDLTSRCAPSALAEFAEASIR